MGVIEGTAQVGTGLGGGRRKTAVGVYDFAVDGGAVGAITLRGDQIPAGAIVVDAYAKVTTPVTSGGAATLAVKVEGAADINAADVVSGAPWSSAGAKRLDFGATTAPILTTVARSIVATVAVAALTAGVFVVVVEYVELAS